MNTEQHQTLPVLPIALLSASAIAYEILLVRLFAIIHWHHYAYMIISLALIGYGVSGTFLAITIKRLQKRYRIALITNMVLFAASLPICFMLAQSIGFVPDAVAYDLEQFFNLVGMYLLLALPFFFAANAIALAMSQKHNRLTIIYAADLIGAGLGSLMIVLALFILHPLTALYLLSAIGLLATLIAAYETGKPSALLYLLITILVVMLALYAGSTGLKMSPYKDLSQTLRVTGSSILEEYSSPLGLIDVVDSPIIPFRHAPGLSLNATTGIPEQLGVFIDGHGPMVINRQNQAENTAQYLAQTTSALPYHIRDLNRVLVPASGTGTGVLQALDLSTAKIDAIELNSQIIDLITQRYNDYSGGLYRNPRVTVFNEEIRGFLQNTNNQYDLINLPLTGSQGSSSGGFLSLNEDYLNSIEAYELYINRLASGGMLAINRWLRLPPRDNLKLINTIIAALEKLGIEEPEKRLAIIRGWQTSITLVRNGAFTQTELDSIRKFSQMNAFDLVYLPGIKPDEVNRYNQLAKPYYYQAATQLLSASNQEFQADYKFNLRPASDDNPYFFHFFRWQSLPEIMQLYGRGGVPLIDAGYLVLVTTLIQAIFASTLLILLPLYYLRRKSREPVKTSQTNRIFWYYSTIGLAFLFIEIAFIQKLTLLLHHPLYSLAVSLAAFLLFAGLGSAYSSRLTQRKGIHSIYLPISMIIAICIVYLFTLDAIFSQLAHLHNVIRIIVSVLIISPLAFFLGMPFPSGLTQLKRHAPEWLPWAWGINGCASVISAVLATVLAIHFGFTVVIMAAVALYVVAAMNFPSFTTDTE